MSDTHDLSMLELFRMEAESQCEALIDGLLSLEGQDASPRVLEGLMRAAHSLKGASRLVGIIHTERLAHHMEDLFVEAQHGRLLIGSDAVDVVLRCVDLIRSAAAMDEDALMAGDSRLDQDVAALVSALKTLARLQAPSLEVPTLAPPEPESLEPQDAEALAAKLSLSVESEEPQPANLASAQDRTLRMAADKLDALLGLAGEVQVASRWLAPFHASLYRLSRQQRKILHVLENLAEGLRPLAQEQLMERCGEARYGLADCASVLRERMVALDAYDRRMMHLAQALHRAVVQSRMRPFIDGVSGFPRMIRDLARKLGKKVELSIEGRHTLVDREVLERMEGAMIHLLRNAVDHGIEPPEVRLAAGKPEGGRIVLRAEHRAGLLFITVEDDGRGLDVEALRQLLVERDVVRRGMAERLSDEEVVEFLFLPSFSTRASVSEISGRGVGLDVVRAQTLSLGGSVAVTGVKGQAMRFELKLPLTLSVIRSLVVEISGDGYGFPLSRTTRVLKIPTNAFHEMEGHQYISWEGEHISVLPAYAVLELPPTETAQTARHNADVCVVVVGKGHNRYGVVVDRLIGLHDLVIQPLDPMLGKVQDINSAATLESGALVLVIDVDDLLKSIERLIHSGQTTSVSSDVRVSASASQQILVVDDSITVREVERRLLESNGYKVDLASDGMEAWNLVRTHTYAMVITDIDMPRMDGFELLSLIRNNPGLSKMPVMIVSYKDQDDYRLRGLELGADYYLSKGSFQDETMLEAVMDMIGPPRERR